MTELPNWHWRVIVYLDGQKEYFGAYEPTRAAAKNYVARRLDAEITDWVECYIPRASWDCPVCHVHEGMIKQPNLRNGHDWECMNCFAKAWGEPMEFDKIKESGSYV
jgi:hypothetical protein